MEQKCLFQLGLNYRLLLGDFTGHVHLVLFHLSSGERAGKAFASQCEESLESYRRLIVDDD